MNDRLSAPALCLALAFSCLPSLASAQATVPAAPVPAVDTCRTAAITTVITCIGHDLRNIVRAPSLQWLLAGGALAGGSVLLDDEVKQAFADPEHDEATPVAIGADLGHAGMQFGVPFAAYLIAEATGHREAGEVAVILLRAQVVNGIVTRSLKMIPRPRPYQESATAAHGSFPSGHTSAAFATATVVQRRWGWRAGLPAYLVAGFIGGSRLQHEHYLSDVTFGAALGIASAMTVTVPTPHGTEATIAPLLAPDAAGISIALSAH